MAKYAECVRSPMHYRIARAIDLECQDDEQAWEAVKAHNLSVAAELSQGARRVGSVIPEPKVTASQQDQ